MRLLETISHWLGRVEVVLAGADEVLREGEEAIAKGEPMRARVLARVVLDRVPGSPFGLALLADACELGGLDAELALTLEELAERLGSRAEIWVRLARARQKTGAATAEVRDAYVRALAVAEAGSDARLETLLGLADLDLAGGDGARANLWLDRVADEKRAEVVLRRAEARLLLGDAAGARALVENVEGDPKDPRMALTRGRAFALAGDPRGFPAILRAYVLEAPGASTLLSSSLAWIPTDEATRARVRLVVEDRGEMDLARFRAAFARAEGRSEEARRALRDALAGGDASAARPLLDAAIDDQDDEALAEALLALPAAEDDALVAEARRLPVADAKLATTPGAEANDVASAAARAFDALHGRSSARVSAWAEALRAQVAQAWIPAAAPAHWSSLLPRLDAHARELHDLDATARIADLAAERRRPVRVAIVGEFNAGKSTFINALMGADVAPTGVLPTTATLHHLRYAPDPIARVIFPRGSEPPERVVPVTELRATLKSIGDAQVTRVEILLPIASLTRVEILDTPGFNAPDARHTEAAHGAFEEADAVIWLLDAAQALKQTERAILEEAERARIPVQILVNKADRLSEADLARVMDLVVTSLGETGIRSWSAPLALSARLALAGRLGDEAALARSGWPAVQALLDAQIVARSEELKERALRRRAAGVVNKLAVAAKTRAEAARVQGESASARAKSFATAAAHLDRDAEEATRRLSETLAPSLLAWRRDMELVVTGRDRQVAAADPLVARYRVERCLAHVAPPLAAGLVELAAGATVTTLELLPLARTLVRTAGFADAAGAELDGPSLARAAVASLVEHLSARATAKETADPAAGLEEELAALEKALGEPLTSRLHASGS